MDEFSIKFLFDAAIVSLKSSNLPEYGQYVNELENNGASRLKIIQNYNEIREDIRKKCESHSKFALIDRHKCAASFMIAILNYLNVEESKLSKENFAIFIGLALIRFAALKDCADRKNYRLLQQLRDKGFLYPKCIRDIEPYPRVWALSIHYGRLSGKLSVLSLANSLYWIERYNRDLAGE